MLVRLGGRGSSVPATVTAATSERANAGVRAGQWLLVAAAAVAMATWAVIAVARLRYPYELDFLESGLVEHARRLTQGESIYPAPSVDFVPFPYPPLYVAVSAVVGWFGIGFLPLRAVSVISTCGTLWMLFRLVSRETASRWAGVVAAGLYAASYRLAGTFFDVARCDALFLFLTLAAVDQLARARDRRTAVLAGTLMAAAILTKQTALFIAAPAAAYLLLTRRPIGIAFSATLAGITGATFVLLDLWSGGWFRYYVVEELSQHGAATQPPWHFFTRDLRPFWPILLVAVLAGGAWVQRSRRWTLTLYAVVAVGLICGAFASRRHSGGYDNVLMPAFAALALLGGLAAGLAVRCRSAAPALLAIGLCLLQFAMLTHSPSAQIPSAADEAYGDSLVARLRALPGEVLVADHPTYGVLAGHRPHAQHAGAFDVFRSTSPHARELLLNSYADAIHSQRFSAIVLDDEGQGLFFPPDWKDFYVKSDVDLGPPPGIFVSRASGSARPREVWLPRPRP